MPYHIVKVADGYEVRSKRNGRIHSKHTTKQNAEKQVRLLRGLDHGFKPARNRKRR